MYPNGSGESELDGNASTPSVDGFSSGSPWTMRTTTTPPPLAPSFSFLVEAIPARWLGGFSPSTLSSSSSSSPFFGVFLPSRSASVGRGDDTNGEWGVVTTPPESEAAEEGRRYRIGRKMGPVGSERGRGGGATRRGRKEEEEEERRVEVWGVFA